MKRNRKYEGKNTTMIVNRGIGNSIFPFRVNNRPDIVNIILETLQEILPKNDIRRQHISKNLITYVEDRKGHDRRYAIAPDKIKKEIGWYPETCFDEGIKLTIKWYLENEAWMKSVTSGDYLKYYEEMYL